MTLKKVLSLAGLSCSLLMNVTLCIGATYTVTYNGNGATSGSMPKDTFEASTSEITTLAPNSYKRTYTVSFETNGGNTISPMACNYAFTGWLHDTLLTSVTNNMEANWYNISTTKGSDIDSKLITLSTEDNINTVSTKPEEATRERLYSKPIYMPTGNYGLDFKFCSPTGYYNLGTDWETTFKLSACTLPQDVYCNDLGLIYTDTDTSSVLLKDEEGSILLTNRNFTIYANDTTPVYLAINCGNLKDGNTYKFKFSDFILSLNGNTFMTYADKAPTASMVREEDGNIELKAQWEAETITLPSPEREGYFFMGWNTKEDGTGTTYKAGDKYKTEEEVTLYAMWMSTKGEYMVVYDGNGATSGEMPNHTYEIGVDETTNLDSNIYQRDYILNFDVNGGDSIESTRIKYIFKGWMHDTLLTSITNDMAANWYNISTTKDSDTDLKLITLSTEDGTNTVSTEPEESTRERLYSKPIYMPAGNYGLDFGFCSPTGYENLGTTWVTTFKLSACSVPQDIYCNDEGLITTDADTSSVLLEDEEGSTTLANRNFTIYADGTTPIYLAINCGNLEDGNSYEFKFADYVLSLNGKTSMFYNDQTRTTNVVREEGGIVNLKAIWEPIYTTLPIPKKEGYTFRGWNTEKDGTGIAYNAGDSCTIDADQTLYAMWAADSTIMGMDNNEADLNTITVYPNPTNGNFTIKANGAANVTIYNATGAKVYSKDIIGDIQVANNFASGIYTVRVTTANGVKTMKLVKK